ncbi:hypothetical protein [Pseudomonas lactis]|uniref:hypothetical protein n=1 Tax=Pseudomonas lactis TaxID=1615674 RepID=UPI00110CE6D3|nr:hypothetical protein [Pseudomonas lactis]
MFGEPLAQSILEGLARVWSKGEYEDERGASGAITAASASIHLADGQDFSAESAGRILKVLFATVTMRDAYLKERLESCCIDQLIRSFIDDPAYFCQLAHKRDANWNALLYKLREHPARSALHAWAVQVALEQPDTLSGSLLDSVLRLAETNAEAPELTPLLTDVLSHWSNKGDGTDALVTGSDLRCADRLRWAYFAVCLQSDVFSNDFVHALDEAEDAVIHRVIFDGYPNCSYWQTPTSTLAVSRLLLQFLFQRTPLMQGHFERVWPDTVKVLKAVSLSDEPGVETILLELLTDSEGTRWVDTIRHELELYRRDVRSQTQKLLSPTDLAKVLSGRGPINAQDLKALVLLSLEEVAAELQPSPHNLWRLFWDNNKPKVENDCRDVLAGKLRDKLGFFGSFEVSPEAASSGGTRADLLVTHGPFTVPVEAKRTSHTHLWYGHIGQLQTYTLANSTEGQGIYVIFWFGNALGVTRPPAGIKPEKPEALKAALENLLPAELAATTSVVVLDVSNAAQAAKVRKDIEFNKAKAAKPLPPKKSKAVAELPQGSEGKGT